MLQKSIHFQAKEFASILLKKNKNGFEKIPLPPMAQLSSINAIQEMDYNKDDYPDFLIFGNLYGSEVETPRNDGGVGLVLLGNENGTFDTAPSAETGILIVGEVKKVLPIQYGKEKAKAFLIAKNDNALELLLLEN